MEIYIKDIDIEYYKSTNLVLNNNSINVELDNIIDNNNINVKKTNIENKILKLQELDYDFNLESKIRKEYNNNNYNKKWIVPIVIEDNIKYINHTEFENDKIKNIGHLINIANYGQISFLNKQIFNLFIKKLLIEEESNFNLEMNEFKYNGDDVYINHIIYIINKILKNDNIIDNSKSLKENINNILINKFDLSKKKINEIIDSKKDDEDDEEDDEEDSEVLNEFDIKIYNYKYTNEDIYGYKIKEEDTICINFFDELKYENNYYNNKENYNKDEDIIYNNYIQNTYESVDKVIQYCPYQSMYRIKDEDLIINRKDIFKSNNDSFVLRLNSYENDMLTIESRICIKNEYIRKKKYNDNYLYYYYDPIKEELSLDVLGDNNTLLKNLSTFKNNSLNINGDFNNKLDFHLNNEILSNNKILISNEWNNISLKNVIENIKSYKKTECLNLNILNKYLNYYDYNINSLSYNVYNEVFNILNLSILNYKNKNKNSKLDFKEEELFIYKLNDNDIIKQEIELSDELNLSEILKKQSVKPYTLYLKDFFEILNNSSNKNLINELCNKFIDNKLLDEKMFSLFYTKFDNFRRIIELNKDEYIKLLNEQILINEQKKENIYDELKDISLNLEEINISKIEEIITELRTFTSINSVNEQITRTNNLTNLEKILYILKKNEVIKIELTKIEEDVHTDDGHKIIIDTSTVSKENFDYTIKEYINDLVENRNKKEKCQENIKNTKIKIDEELYIPKSNYHKMSNILPSLVNNSHILDINKLESESIFISKKMKDEIDAEKNKWFENGENNIKKCIKTFYNPYELIDDITLYSKIEGSRASNKLWEILYNEETKFINNPKFLFLAEAPGGFIDTCSHLYYKFNNQEWNNDYFVITKYDTDLIRQSTFMEKHASKMIIKLEDKNTFKLYESVDNIDEESGNLMNTNIINGSVSLLSEQKFDIITADGGFNVVDYNANIDELEFSILYMGEILTAIKTQNVGGIFVLKINDFYTNITQYLIYILNNCYETIEIIKPYTSRVLSSEKYIKCKNFKNQNNTNIIDKLKDLLEQFSIIHNNYTINKDKDTFINSFKLNFTHNENIDNKLDEIRIKLFNYQITNFKQCNYVFDKYQKDSKTKDFINKILPYCKNKLKCLNDEECAWIMLYSLQKSIELCNIIELDIKYQFKSIDKILNVQNENVYNISNNFDEDKNNLNTDTNDVSRIKKIKEFVNNNCVSYRNSFIIRNEIYINLLEFNKIIEKSNDYNKQFNEDSMEFLNNKNMNNYIKKYINPLLEETIFKKYKDNKDKIKSIVINLKKYVGKYLSKYNYQECYCSHHLLKDSSDYLIDNICKFCNEIFDKEEYKTEYDQTFNSVSSNEEEIEEIKNKLNTFLLNKKYYINHKINEYKKIKSKFDENSFNFHKQINELTELFPKENKESVIIILLTFYYLYNYKKLNLNGEAWDKIINYLIKIMKVNKNININELNVNINVDILNDNIEKFDEEEEIFQYNTTTYYDNKLYNIMLFDSNNLNMYDYIKKCLYYLKNIIFTVNNIEDENINILSNDINYLINYIIKIFYIIKLNDELCKNKTFLTKIQTNDIKLINKNSELNNLLINEQGIIQNIDNISSEFSFLKKSKNIVGVSLYKYQEDDNYNYSDESFDSSTSPLQSPRAPPPRPPPPRPPSSRPPPPPPPRRGGKFNNSLNGGMLSSYDFDGDNINSSSNNVTSSIYDVEGLIFDYEIDSDKLIDNYVLLEHNQILCDNIIYKFINDKNLFKYSIKLSEIEELFIFDEIENLYEERNNSVIINMNKNYVNNDYNEGYFNYDYNTLIKKSNLFYDIKLLENCIDIDNNNTFLEYSDKITFSLDDNNIFLRKKNKKYLMYSKLISSLSSKYFSKEKINNTTLGSLLQKSRIDLDDNKDLYGLNINLFDKNRIVWKYIYDELIKMNVNNDNFESKILTLIKDINELEILDMYNNEEYYYLYYLPKNIKTVEKNIDKIHNVSFYFPSDETDNKEILNKSFDKDTLFEQFKIIQNIINDDSDIMNRNEEDLTFLEENEEEDMDQDINSYL